MKVIDLEYLISNKEECPKTIVYEGEIYGFRDDLNDYENQYADFEEGVNKFKYLFDNPLEKNFRDFFNDEIEILEEEKKIEHIDLSEITGEICCISPKEEKIQNKINEIIDYLKSKGE